MNELKLIQEKWPVILKNFVPFDPEGEDYFKDSKPIKFNEVEYEVPHFKPEFGNRKVTIKLLTVKIKYPDFIELATQKESKLLTFIEEVTGIKNIRISIICNQNPDKGNFLKKDEELINNNKKLDVVNINQSINNVEPSNSIQNIPVKENLKRKWPIIIGIVLGLYLLLVFIDSRINFIEFSDSGTLNDKKNCVTFYDENGDFIDSCGDNYVPEENPGYQGR